MYGLYCALSDAFNASLVVSRKKSETHEGFSELYGMNNETIPLPIEHHGMKSETEGALIETHEAFLPVDEAFFLNRDAF